MNEIEAALRRLTRDLRDLDVRWALVGGLAVAQRANPRFTNDIDVAVVTSGDAAAEGLAFALSRRGYTPEFTVEDEITGRLMTQRFGSAGSAGSDLLIDLLFSSCGIEAEIVADAEVVPVFRGLTVPVATRAHLMAMKVLAMNANRARDADDIEQLIRRSTATDLEGTRAALALITERGFNRDKDLSAVFDDFVARYWRPS